MVTLASIIYAALLFLILTTTAVYDISFEKGR